jgi:hypothetical protein
MFLRCCCAAAAVLLPRVHLSGCADPSAQALHHDTAALGALSELLERLGSERRRRLLAHDVVPGHRVARQRLEGRERARSFGARAEGGRVSVALSLGGGERECARICAVAICAGAIRASQTLRTRNGPMLACRLRHLCHPRDSGDRSKCQPPNTLYPRPSNACILWLGLRVQAAASPAWGRQLHSLSPWWPVSRKPVSDWRSGTADPGSTHRFCPADDNVAGEPLRNVVQAGQALSALSFTAVVAGHLVHRERRAPRPDHAPSCSFPRCRSTWRAALLPCGPWRGNRPARRERAGRHACFGPFRGFRRARGVR